MPVNAKHPEYIKHLPQWERCRDINAGQDAVHGGGEKYLPKLKAQDNDSYKAYVKRTPFYNATWRTTSGLLGMMFRKPAKVVVPAGLEELIANIDGQGLPAQMFFQQIGEEALKFGRVGILVDCPPASPGLTQADALRLNLRPTMSLYTCFSIINWHDGVVNNVKTSTMFVLEEEKDVPVDEFTNKTEQRWRVLDLVPSAATETEPEKMVYRQRVFKLKKDAPANSAEQAFEQEGEDIIPLMLGKPLNHIPFKVMGTDDISTKCDTPPMIDLVDVNLSHYRSSADMEHGCHFTALPMLFLAGFKQEMDEVGKPIKLFVGSEQAVVSSNVGAKGEYIEFSGSGLAAIEGRIEKKEQQMAILGARMLEPMQKGVEAAETATIHRAGENSMLGSVSQSLSLGLTDCMKWLVAWTGRESADVLVEINKSFMPMKMSTDMIRTIVSNWQQGVPGYSDASMFAQLQEGETIPEELKLEDEQAAIFERQQQMLLEQAAANQLLSDTGGGSV